MNYTKDSTEVYDDHNYFILGYFEKSPGNSGRQGWNVMSEDSHSGYPYWTDTRWSGKAYKFETAVKFATEISNAKKLGKEWNYLNNPDKICIAQRAYVNITDVNSPTIQDSHTREVLERLSPEEQDLLKKHFSK